MKFQFKYIMMAATAAVLSMGSVSCDDSSIDDLKGIYEAPIDLQVKSVTLANKTKEGNLRTFELDLATDNGTSMKLAVVANNYFIPTSGYTPASKDAAKNGNLVSELSTINGSAVTEGTFALTQNGSDYTINKSVLFTADGKSYRFSGTFSLELDPDDPTALNKIKPQYSQMGEELEYVDNGDGTYTICFTTGGYTAAQNTSTWLLEYTGEGYEWQIQFILPDGKLHEGTYKAGEGYVAGYETTYEGYGWFAGTQWGTIENGARKNTFITSGDIVVTKNGSKYSVFMDQGKGGVFAEYKGAIKSLDPDASAGGDDDSSTKLTFGGLQSWVAWGGNTVAIGFAAPGASIAYDASIWGFAAKGTGVAFNVEFFSTDGTLAPGTYTAAANGSVAAGNWLQGYDNGYGGFGGSVLHNVSNDVDTPSALTEGTFEVTKEGDLYTITTTINGVDYKYKGYLSDRDAELGGDDDEATELTYGGGNNWVSWGGTTIALSFAAPGASIAYDASIWSFVAKGTGIAFNVEFFSTDGTLEPGTYTPAANGSVAAGNWLQGYDNGYGGFGGSVFHQVDNDVDSPSAFTEGTFEVSKDGDNYTITTTINGVDYKYCGPITL